MQYLCQDDIFKIVLTNQYSVLNLRCYGRGEFWAWQDDIKENIKCGLIEILILALLTDEDMYGYKIKTELANRTNQTFLVKEGLYMDLYIEWKRGG